MVLYKRTQMNACNRECLSELSRQLRYWFWPACVAVVSVLCHGHMKSTRTTNVDICSESPVQLGVWKWVGLQCSVHSEPCLPALWAHDSALNHRQMPCRSHWSRWWIYSSLLVILLCISWAFYTDLLSRHSFPWVKLTSCSRNGYDFSRRFDPDVRFFWVSEIQGLTVASKVYSFVASLLLPSKSTLVQPWRFSLQPSRCPRPLTATWYLQSVFMISSCPVSVFHKPWEA